MKINSNTIKLEKESHEVLEKVIRKIASENNIENVESIKITLSQDQGVIGFKVAQTPPVEEETQEVPVKQQPVEQQPPVEESQLQQTQEIAPVQETEEETPALETTKEPPTVAPEEGTEEQDMKTLIEGTGKPLSPEEAQDFFAKLQKRQEASETDQESVDKSWYGELEELVNKAIAERGQPQQ